MSQSIPEKSLVLQELEVLEKFLLETPEHGIQEAANYILERVKLNAEKLKQTNETHLEPRWMAVLERVKKYFKTKSNGRINLFLDSNLALENTSASELDKMMSKRHLMLESASITELDIVMNETFSSTDANFSKILLGYNALQDDESKRLFVYLLIMNFDSINDVDKTFFTRKIILLTLKNRLLEKGKNLNNYDDYNIDFFFGKQYFSLPYLTREDNEIFVDCGAYDGQTIKDFVEFTEGNYKKIYSFEPIPSHYKCALENIEKWGIQRVELINKGLWNCETKFNFSESGGGSRIKDTGTIPTIVVPIDDVIPDDERTTFIKMDIEGAEYEALLGAQKTIRKCKPKLAICIYHKPQDIIEIPSLILSFFPEYKLYIRHYELNRWETILYAIPPNIGQTNERISPSQTLKSLVLQELEVMENFLLETPEHGIKEAANYILGRVKLNVEKLKQTNETYLEPRWMAVLHRIEKYLTEQASGQNRHSDFNDLRKKILRDFQCKTDLNTAEITALLQTAEQKNFRFSAQVAQDIIAYLFFKGKADGFYIDIGANDGISGSTTFWAQQAGWKGICVEPQKSTFDRMKKVRNCALYNCAVSNKSQENVEFISFPDKDTRSGLADSMSQSHIEEAKKLSDMEKNFVSTKTFGDIMSDFPDVKFIEFLSIDTEGHEMQVLESIDFTKFKFGLITIETEDGSDVAKYVENNGYKKLMTAGSDVLFVPKDYDIPVSCAIFPFEVKTNQYTGLMKNILQTINIKPTDNLAASDFIWLHWFENKLLFGDLQQKMDFLKKSKENGQKIIWNVHNKQPHETDNAEQVRNLMKSLAEYAYKIVIHSKMTTQVIKELCGNDEKILQKIIFVPHPHYSGTYGSLCPQNSLSNDKLKILFFGQIRPYKNIELLIKVFNDLDFDDVELNICGNCSNENYKRDLLNLIKTDKIKSDFRFIADDEVAYLLAQNHILLLPYSLESSLNSGATILAFSYSRSVISSLNGTLDDIEDKSLFFSYDYKTHEEHERKLKEILTQIRERYHGKYDELLALGEKCRKNVLENNSYLKTAQGLAQVFDVKVTQQIQTPPPAQNIQKSLVLQELEVMEKFLLETPEHGIKEAANYIFERIKLNVEKLKQTNETNLEPRWTAVLRRIEKYLGAASAQKQTVGWVIDDLRRDILTNFQNRVMLSPQKISELLVTAQRQNLRFSAQAAQDIMAYLFFEGKKDGFYVEIATDDKINASAVSWAKQIGWKGIQTQPQEIFTKPFDDIMKDFSGVKHIDFLSINAQEREMRVLESIDFTKFKFGLIAIETQDGSGAVKYIEKNGYKKLIVAASYILFVPVGVQTKNLPQYSKEQPLVSVICLAYNHEKFIRKCLDGFVMQKTDFAFEVIVHEDASTDKTADIVREYQEKYPEIIKPIFQSENQYSKGHLGNMAEKICSNITGKYTAYCDGDDYWTDEYKLQIQADFLESHPEFSMCSGGYYRNNIIDSKLNEQSVFVSENPVGLVYDYKTAIGLWCRYTYPLTIMYRTNIFLDYCKSFSKNFKSSVDIHLVYFALQHGNGYYFSRQLASYTVHTGGVWSGLDDFEKIKTNQNLYKGLWEYTKDGVFVEKLLNFTVSLLKNFWRLSIEERKELLNDVKKLNLQVPADYLEQISQSVINRYIKQPRKTLRFTVHLTDHCNLNCKHCAHFCSIAEERFADIAVLDRDFKRLSDLVNRQNEYIDLQGGEPLLHPQINDIMIMARKHFDGVIRIVTNGILLPNMPDSFWQTAHDNNIVIDISVYPIKIDNEKIARNLAKFGVSTRSRKKAGENEWFRGRYDIEGKQNPERQYLKCGFGNNYWCLEDGKLSCCGAAHYIKHLNKCLDKKFEVMPKDCVDIFKVNSFQEIAENFAKATPFCRYCTLKIEYVRWEQSRKEVSEWL